MRKLAVVMLISVAVGGFCVAPVSAHARGGDSEFLGTGIGAALGGLLGSQFGHGDGQLAYTGLGVFLGGLAGNSVGSSMDRADSVYYGSRGYGRAYGYGYNYYSVPDYSYYQPNYVAPPPHPRRPVIYVQPQVVEYRSYNQPVYTEESYVGYSTSDEGASSSGHCREFTQQIRIGDRMEESYGTACLQPDGSWRIER